MSRLLLFQSYISHILSTFHTTYIHDGWEHELSFRYNCLLPPRTHSLLTVRRDNKKAACSPRCTLLLGFNHKPFNSLHAESCNDLDETASLVLTKHTGGMAERWLSSFSRTDLRNHKARREYGIISQGNPGQALSRMGIHYYVVPGSALPS